MRRELRESSENWTISRYEFLLNDLAKANEYGKLLKSLLLLFKTAPSCGDDDAVRIHWNLQHWALREESSDIALNWYLAKWLPEQTRNSVIDNSGNLSEDEVENQLIERLRVLTETLQQHCLNSLQLKKDKSRITGNNYTPAQCKEPNPHWRRAYIDALTELRLNNGGKAHKVAHFIRNGDFDTGTREQARLAHNSLRKLKPHNNSQDIHRSYLAALWCLRIGKANASEVKFDLKQAQRWRSRELQRVN